MFPTLIKIALAAQKPVPFVQYFLKGGRSVSSYLIVKRLKEYCTQLSMVVDAGANEGQFAIAVRYFFPKTKIYSFEPLTEAFDVLKRITSHMSGITLERLALGNRSGQLCFYKNHYTGASSALKIHENQNKYFLKTSFTEEVEVRVSTLDDFMKNQSVERPLLLKLDVQGYEKNVLLGARQFLKSVDYLLLEMSFVPMYENELIFHEMHSFISSLGFEIVAPLDFLQTEDMVIVQMDVLYRRTD